MKLALRIEFGFSGLERRRQPERLQTCYENHNAVQITGAYLRLDLKLAVDIISAKRTFDFNTNELTFVGF